MVNIGEQLLKKFDTKSQKYVNCKAIETKEIFQIPLSLEESRKMCVDLLKYMEENEYSQFTIENTFGLLLVIQYPICNNALLDTTKLFNTVFRRKTVYKRNK